MDNRQHRRFRPRGMSLIEGMVASLVLLLGLLGVIQGVLFASTQNAMAGRMTRAGAIAQQIMAGLQAAGRGRLMAPATGIFNATNCVTTAPVPAGRAGALYPKPPGLAAFNACWVDLDARDPLLAADEAVMPGYAADDTSEFKRTVAFYFNPADTSVAYVGVAVAWRELGGWKSHHRIFAIYDPTVNETGVEL